MNDPTIDDRQPLSAARRIAEETLAGRYDLLLACRDLAALRRDLSFLPDRVMDVFVAVASETDELPIGIERRQWAVSALHGKDEEASSYRDRVSDAVAAALGEVLAALRDG